MPLGIPRGASCVQRFDDSLNSAIHITYRISLRSSSMPEPRDPLLKVLIHLKIILRSATIKQSLGWPPAGRLQGRSLQGNSLQGNSLQGRSSQGKSAEATRYVLKGFGV